MGIVHSAHGIVDKFEQGFVGVHLGGIGGGEITLMDSHYDKSMVIEHLNIATHA